MIYEKERRSKEGNSRIQRKSEYRSKKVREVRNGRGKRLQERRSTRKVYNKDVIWME